MEIPHPRKPLRLPGYDYSQPGAYFITVVTWGRQLLLEDPVLQKCVHQTWEELPTRFPQVALDAFVVMPNHIHGIVIINSETDYAVGTTYELSLHRPLQRIAYDMAPAERRQMLVPKVLSYFKMQSSKRVNLMRKSPGTSVWQRSYHDHVIRDEAELTNVREYIQNNPLQWELDAENPINRRDNSRGVG